MVSLIPKGGRICARTLGIALVACLTVPAGLEAAAQAAPGRPTAIQSVDAAPIPDADASAVTIHANGPLPAPVVGVLDAPARIYLDFKGVRLPSGVTAQWEDPRLRGVRLSQFKADPLVARVVIDLHNPITHTLDLRERASGKIVVRLGAPEPAAAPGAPPAPARSRDAERYLAQVSAALGRLHALRQVIASIDGRVVVPDADFPAAAAELDSLARSLGGVKAPESLATTHDLLMRSCALGSRAVRLRLEFAASADVGAEQNAASAAAGALILLDRATRDLGYVPR
jgi:hypothetical protein